MVSEFYKIGPGQFIWLVNLMRFVVTQNTVLGMPLTEPPKKFDWEEIPTQDGGSRILNWIIRKGKAFVFPCFLTRDQPLHTLAAMLSTPWWTVCPQTVSQTSLSHPYTQHLSDSFRHEKSQGDRGPVYKRRLWFLWKRRLKMLLFEPLSLFRSLEFMKERVESMFLRINDA